jgi:hypothetical protein
MENNLEHLFEYITKTDRAFGELYMYTDSKEAPPMMIMELLEIAHLE